MVCGWTTSYFRYENEKGIWNWNQSKSYSIPNLVLPEVHIVQIAVGWKHVVACTTHGQVN